MNLKIMSLVLIASFSNVQAAESIKDLYHCKGRRIEVLVQTINQEERILVTRPNNSYSYFDCNRNVLDQQVAYICDGVEFSPRVRLAIKSAGNSGSIRLGVLGFKRKLTCQKMF